MATKFYKVVSQGLHSCCQNPSFPHKYRVKYKIGEFVQPVIEGTKLFVFKDLEKARVFANKEYNWQIYSCEAKNPGVVKFLGSIWNIAQFWAAKKKHKQTLNYRMYAPQGTYSCDEVKLLEYVDKSRY